MAILGSRVSFQSKAVARLVRTGATQTNRVQLGVSSDRNVVPSEVTLWVSLDIQQPVMQIQWDHQGDDTIDAQGAGLYGASCDVYSTRPLPAQSDRD